MPPRNSRVPSAIYSRPCGVRSSVPDLRRPPTICVQIPIFPLSPTQLFLHFSPSVPMAPRALPWLLSRPSLLISAQHADSGFTRTARARDVVARVLLKRRRRSMLAATPCGQQSNITMIRSGRCTATRSAHSTSCGRGFLRRAMNTASSTSSRAAQNRTASTPIETNSVRRSFASASLLSSRWATRNRPRQGLRLSISVSVASSAVAGKTKTLFWLAHSRCGPREAVELGEGGSSTEPTHWRPKLDSSASGSGTVNPTISPLPSSRAKFPCYRFSFLTLFFCLSSTLFTFFSSPFLPFHLRLPNLLQSRRFLAASPSF